MRCRNVSLITIYNLGGLFHQDQPGSQHQNEINFMNSEHQSKKTFEEKNAKSLIDCLNNLQKQHIDFRYKLAFDFSISQINSNQKRFNLNKSLTTTTGVYSDGTLKHFEIFKQGNYNLSVNLLVIIDVLFL